MTVEEATAIPELATAKAAKAAAASKQAEAEAAVQVQVPAVADAKKGLAKAEAKRWKEKGPAGKYTNMGYTAEVREQHGTRHCAMGKEE